MDLVMSLLNGGWGLLLTMLKDLYPFALAGGSVVGALYAAKYFLAHPDSKWAMWYPIVLQSVRLAESAIPDNTANAGLAKADYCLKMFNELYTKHTGEVPSAALVDWATRMKELALLELDKIKAATPAPNPATVVNPPVAPKV